jgi:hypothetical protein
MEAHREQPFGLSGTKTFLFRNNFESFGNITMG